MENFYSEHLLTFSFLHFVYGRFLANRGSSRNGFVRLPTKGLVTNYGEGGGATKREGEGHVKFYPYEKGGGGKSFSQSEGGGVGGHKQF